MTQTTNHTRFWRLCTAFAVGCFLMAGNVNSAWAAISIGSASWSSSNHRLSVSGSGASSRSTVTITYYGGDNVPIGTTQASRRGSWSANFYNLNPVPCRVRASDGSTSAVRNVSNAGSNCSDSGGPSNTPLSPMPADPTAARRVFQ